MDFDYAVAPVALLIFAIVVMLLSARYMGTLASRPRGKFARTLDLTILAAANFFVVGVGISSCVNAVLAARFRAKNPEPGADYQVNGHRMHLNCIGAGSPTIVLDAGLGWDSLVWGR